MLYDWAFAKRGFGIIVLSQDGAVLVLEFNEFLHRIACRVIQADDVVVSGVLTDGARRRAGDMRLYAMARSGAVRTGDLPRRVPGGVLASGREARMALEALENRVDRDAATLLRPVAAPLPSALAAELLRAVPAALSSNAPGEMLRSSSPETKPPR